MLIHWARHSMAVVFAGKERGGRMDRKRAGMVKGGTRSGVGAAVVVVWARGSVDVGSGASLRNGNGFTTRGGSCRSRSVARRGTKQSYFRLSNVRPTRRSGVRSLLDEASHHHEALLVCYGDAAHHSLQPQTRRSGLLFTHAEQQANPHARGQHCGSQSLGH